jgi:hypothetical protein
MGFGVWVVPHAELKTNVESIRSIVAVRSAAVERLALGIVDILLAYDAFDEYWLCLPFAQSELDGRDFIKDRRVSDAALLEIADAVAACVSECLRGASERRAA